MRKILLRFDDICPTMNWKQWDKAKQMMDKAGVTALLGVIPDCTDPDLMIDAPRPDFWAYIKGLQEVGFTIAMHGYHHQFELKADGLVTRNKISEFAGLPYEVQLEKIQKGKNILEQQGIKTDVFYAPAHSYDDNTLKALAACGFRYVSDGLSIKPYKRKGLILIPCHPGGIPRIEKKTGYITAVIHAHEWVREDRLVEWFRYQNLFINHAKEIVPFCVFCQWKSANPWLQRVIEKLLVFTKQYVVPYVFKMIRNNK